MDVNGWAVIRRMLRRRRIKQYELADMLGFSPAAITQAKKGDFQLSVEVLEKILLCLDATDEEQDAFYAHLIQKRFFEKAETDIVCQVIIIRKKK